MRQSIVIGLLTVALGAFVTNAPTQPITWIEPAQAWGKTPKIVKSNPTVVVLYARNANEWVVWSDGRVLASHSGMLIDASKDYYDEPPLLVVYNAAAGNFSWGFLDLSDGSYNILTPSFPRVVCRDRDLPVIPIAVSQMTGRRVLAAYANDAYLCEIVVFMNPLDPLNSYYIPTRNYWRSVSDNGDLAGLRSDGIAMFYSEALRVEIQLGQSGEFSEALGFFPSSGFPLGWVRNDTTQTVQVGYWEPFNNASWRPLFSIPYNINPAVAYISASEGGDVVASGKRYDIYSYFSYFWRPWWTQPVELNDVYRHLLGYDLIAYVTDISRDGRYLVGLGYRPGLDSVWVFLLDTQCSAHDGDVNGDRCVDDADLLQVLFDFGRSGELLGRVDINCDGTVDDADLLTVLFNFGSGC